MSKGFSPQMHCDHANEFPSVCPCSAVCMCRTGMCLPDYSGPVVCSRWLSDDLHAEARLDGNRAVVGVHSLEHGIDSERVCAIVEADGSSTLSGGVTCGKAAGSPGWGPFLEEVASLLPAAVVMLT